MFRPVRLLKVISAIMIIIGVIAVGAVVMFYLLNDSVGELLGDLGLVSSKMPLLKLGISVAGGTCWILAGIFGLSGKSRRMALLFGLLYSLFVAYNLLDNILHNGFGLYYVPGYIFNVIVFAVFWWGMYRSKK